MKTETKRLGAYVGLLLTFASIGFLASRRAFAVPFGTTEQCGATREGCTGPNLFFISKRRP